MISVITAVYNGEKFLPYLIESLRKQSDSDFEWVVADGASTDGTMLLLEKITDLNIVITSCNDFGVYDALNRAIKISTGTYYIVCGADDILNDDAISNYKKAINDSHPDIVTANVMANEKVISIRRPICIYNLNSVISSHSIGAAIRRSLHDQYGYYSNLYPICADKLFVEKVYLSGVIIKRCDFIAGRYSGTGLSSVQVAKTLSENLCISLELGHNKVIQLFLFILRIFKNYNKI